MKLQYSLARPVRRITLSLGILAFLALLSSQSVSASAGSPSFIRIINASPGVGTVDVFIDGTKLLSNTSYATVTDYIPLPSGTHKVQLALIGKGVGAAAITQALSVQAGAAYTVAALGTKSTRFSLKVFIDNNLMASGMAKVRLYYLSPGSGSVSVAAGGNTVISNLPYPQASNYFRLAAGSYMFKVTATQPAFTLPDAVTLQTETVTSIFVIGLFKGNPNLQLINVQVRGLPSMSGTGSDPNVLPNNSQPFALLAPWPLGVLALGGMSAGVLTGLRLFGRRKTADGSPRLAWSLLAVLLALALSIGGLSLASNARLTPALLGRLLIPEIGVNAPIESVGVLPGGNMETPTQKPWNDVGWYNVGPRPGERGSAVINGHLDRPGGNPAVFWHLRDLHNGDKVMVVDVNGKTLSFHVTRSMFYLPQDAPVQDIFGNTAGSFLNLTSCAGDWIPTEHQTALRLVIYTSLDSTNSQA